MVSLDILQCWKHKSGASMGTSYLNISMQNEGLGQKVAKISCFRKFGGFIQNVSIFTGKINFFLECCHLLLMPCQNKKAQKAKNQHPEGPGSDLSSSSHLPG